MPEVNQNPKKKLAIWMPLLFALVLAIGMVVGTRLKKTPQVIIKTDDASQVLDYSKLGQGRIEDLIRFVEARYVDEVNSEELIEQAIKNILDQLDPHSNYITATDLKKVNEELKGNFEGVGIEFMVLDDTIMVVSALSGGPSEKAGIMAGDKIVEIADSVAVGKDIEPSKLVNKLRGEQGTDVKIGVLRGNDEKVKHFTVTRDEIPMHSVDVGYMLDNQTGYIKINRFSATTTTEFMEKLKILVEQEGLKDLVIDLRQNPGGYLQEATKILSQFFKEAGKLLVYTEGRTVSRNDYESTGQNFFDVEKIAVLIDEGSASASEIVAGAFQDWDRGVIVGRRSFGKGLVQEQYELKDGSALRLTVARYYTPTNRSIQRAYDDKNAYDSDVITRFNGGELLNKDSIQISDTTQYLTLNENRVVYGGGGITPDIFVPIDTTHWNDHYIALRQILPQFVYRYKEANQDEFSEMTLESFRREFNIDDDLLEEFLVYAAEKGVNRNYGEEAIVNNITKKLLKARIARSLFQEKGFFTVWNDEDEVVKAALNALKSANPLTYSK